MSYPGAYGEGTSSLTRCPSMAPHHLIPMSRKELSHVSVFAQLAKRAIAQADAAKKLHLSVRQVQRKLRAYRKRGPRSLVHRLRGRPSNHRLPAGLKDRALTLIRDHYPDFGPTFAAEKLAECHGLTIHHETLRLLLIERGLWRPHQGPVTAHVWRERKACRGEMVQTDGSLHHWFEDRAPACTLLAFIDDATSELLWLEFVQGESTAALMMATWRYLERAGRPVSLYVDRGGVFRVNIHNEEQDKLTQYARALNELDIDLIHARSPQAKGRVERVFGTLQDRLVKELRLAGISTIEEADRFVREVYLERHNAKFTVAPKRPADLHRPLTGYALSRIFCTREERTVRNDFTLKYRKRLFQLDPRQPTLLRPGDDVTVSEGLDGAIAVGIRQVALRFQEIAERPLPPVRARVSSPRVPWKPPADHPWRRPVLVRHDISMLRT